MTADKEYKKWIVELKAKIQSAQIKAAVTVNRQLLELYRELGREIYEKQKRSAWGDGLIEQVAKARETLKNPYNFVFLTLGKEAKEPKRGNFTM